MILRPIIHIELSAESISFALKKRRLDFLAYMNIRVHRGHALPIAIGEKRDYPDSILLYIYDFDKIAELNLDKTALLKLMFDYGIGKSLEKFWYPPRKPLVIFHGQEKLFGVLGGEYKKILENIAIQAQAWKVEFE